MGINGISIRTHFIIFMDGKMILKILHFLFGHWWSEWEHKVVNEGYYDEEHWIERNCKCGATQQEED